MKREDKKAAIAAYKERDVATGIYAVRCRPSGQSWVGRAPDLGTVQNRLWFTLRQGTSPHRSLQAAWTEYGPDGFSFEVIEELGDDVAEIARDRVLKERLAHWRAELGAETL